MSFMKSYLYATFVIVFTLSCGKVPNDEGANSTTTTISASTISNEKISVNGDFRLSITSGSDVSPSLYVGKLKVRNANYDYIDFCHGDASIVKSGDVLEASFSNVRNGSSAMPEYCEKFKGSFTIRDLGDGIISYCNKTTSSCFYLK